MLVAAVLAGCRVELDQERLGGGDFESARTLCVVEPPMGVSRDVAFSLAFDAGSYWIFDETQVGSTTLAGSGATVAPGGDPCSDLVDVTDGDGELMELLELTAEEAATDLEDGARFALIPRSGFAVGAEGWLYYEKSLVRGFFDVESIGVGVARIELGRAAQRMVVGEHAHEPTLLWLAPQHGWARNAVVAPDGLAYVYGCEKRAAWDEVCRVARVEPSRAAEVDAYQYWTGDDWAERSQDAGTVVEDTQSFSVAFNPHLRRYVGIHAGLLENRVLGRSATAPWGPFGFAEEIYEGTAPSAFWIRGVVQHPGHQEAGGRRILTSYATSPEGGVAGLRLVEVTLR